MNVKGENRIVLDHSKINKVCGLFPICQRPTDVYSKGFRWNIDSNTPFEYGFVVSNSNQIVTDEQVVTSSEPIVFTFELNNKEDLFQSS
jgi:thiamine pyrophosphokinase